MSRKAVAYCGLVAASVACFWTCIVMLIFMTVTSSVLLFVLSLLSLFFNTCALVGAVGGIIKLSSLGVKNV